MYKITLSISLFFILAIFQQGCSGRRLDKNLKPVPDNAYLFRSHIDKDSTWIEPNTNCYYVENAGMNMNHGGWHWPTDLEPKNNDFFYWEAETWGMVKIEFELPAETAELNFDTLSRLKHDFINYFYGYARSDSTVDHLSGVLAFKRNSANYITINGTITINTERPTTHQEIVFKDYSLKILSLSEAIQKHKAEQDEIRRQLKKQLEVDN